MEKINMSDFTTAELADARQTLEINIKIARREILTSTNGDMVMYYQRNLPIYLEKLAPILSELEGRRLADATEASVGV